ncbi:DUF3644 domain-containing protein [Arthrobacter oryzae]|uniref:DUF3644 domain-containing protein n=1 Tax=Arthrobacter oryzae TaxID=409290 RepID=UPI0028547498|nr:DUF3644 domain-containing protein [Arthrobacter oryzae]MDR6507743.1 hypothetical protein [Arthrobacter oryzae]
MPPRQKWWHTMQEARRQACVAVDFYNRPGDRRSFADFVVHMHLAWQNLLHADLVRRGENIFYREKNGRYKRDKNKQKQSWDLQHCLKRAFGDNDPARVNVEFFIGIRNSIEHRYEDAILLTTAAYAHAYVINFERELTARFGRDETLADELRFPVFVQSLTPEGMDEQRSLRRDLPTEARTYITEFEASLPDSLRSDTRYEYRIQLSPMKGPKSEADLAIQFVNSNTLSPEELESLLATQKGTVIIVEKLKLGGFDNEMLPKKAAQAVQEQTGFAFEVHHFTKMRQRDGVGPKPRQKGNASDGMFCVFSTPHANHVYTLEYVAKLIEELRDPGRYRTALGQEPVAYTAAPSRR